MHWSSWSDFFSMGGYALYVWGSYGVTFLLLGAEVLALLKRKRTLAWIRRPRELETRKSKIETVL
jgi:heme exporter protein D